MLNPGISGTMLFAEIFRSDKDLERPGQPVDRILLPLAVHCCGVAVVKVGGGGGGEGRAGGWVGEGP